MEHEFAGSGAGGAADGGCGSWGGRGGQRTGDDVELAQARAAGTGRPSHRWVRVTGRPSHQAVRRRAVRVAGSSESPGRRIPAGRPPPRPQVRTWSLSRCDCRQTSVCVLPYVRASAHLRAVMRACVRACVRAFICVRARVPVHVPSCAPVGDGRALLGRPSIQPAPCV